jgi:hypothetical protein
MSDGQSDGARFADERRQSAREKFGHLPIEEIDARCKAVRARIKRVRKIANTLPELCREYDELLTLIIEVVRKKK